MRDITQELVNFVVDTEYKDLPQEVVHESKRILLDTIGCALAGLATDKGRISVALARRLGGPPEAMIWGMGDRVSSSAAAFANGELINALDMDALLIPGGHITPLVIPAPLALAESVGASGKDLIIATAFGHEISSRVAEGLTEWRGYVEEGPDRGKQISPAVQGMSACIFGGTSACGKVLKFEPVPPLPYYEQFTRDQILANAWLGHLIQGYFKDELDPDWILTHQCVWASKSDTGSTSMFPIHELRETIANHKQPSKVVVGAYDLPDLGHHEEDDSGWWDMTTNEVRCEIESGVVPWAKPDPRITYEEPKADVLADLYKMGFNTGMFANGGDRMDRARKAVRIFQKSTLAYKRRQNRRAEVLATDGAVGPKTKAAIEKRIRELRLG